MATKNMKQLDKLIAAAGCFEIAVKFEYYDPEYEEFGHDHYIEECVHPRDLKDTIRENFANLADGCEEISATIYCDDYKSVTVYPEDFEEENVQQKG